MKKAFLLFLASILLFNLTVKTAFADGESTCQTIYNGGETCRNPVKFTINKFVQKPGTNNYVDNLTTSGPKYKPSQNVTFKITIENTGTSDITNLDVVDSFPQFLTFVSGAGSFNAGTSQLNFVIGLLPKGKKVEYLVATKTASSDKYSQAITCVTNNVKATSNDGSIASDNSQLCIENAGTKITTSTNPPVYNKPQVTTVPATGPEMVYLFGLIPTGLAGFFIKKRAS